MFVVLLRFAENRGEASQYMAAHNDWIQWGFSDGVFLVVGSLQEKLGGGILAQENEIERLKERIDQDPFVIHNIVTAEIIEIAPNRVDERLAFMLQK
ncbi:hypothetical protein OLMES_4502 [Oleiphilus messinensis]|uniref:YCII-related domain-containing protein n=1 Tax=Oleiphilus messinensis TaxID=141451 RepID=A0A1Y0ID86_9GAMM|nr:hypothetical protein [Oleiphilus messinensis]ARU58498.1 hypothetical protein OLMES_4502 [Oleiphilus messinensis]